MKIRTTASGWAMPDDQRTAHFFRRGTSLCRSWSYGGETYPTPSPMGFHCRICAERAPR